MDTMVILDATKDEVGPCRKLQCLVRHYADPTDLQAHRATRVQQKKHISTKRLRVYRYRHPFRTLALDDCRSLRLVMGFLCARLSISLVELHRRFAVSFDEAASVAQLQSLLDDNRPR